MTAGRKGQVWLVLGGATLAVLWTGVLLKTTWMHWAGIGFLSVPYVSALLMTLPNWRGDRTSSLCAVGLFLLFCLAWIL